MNQWLQDYNDIIELCKSHNYIEALRFVKALINDMCSFKRQKNSKMTKESDQISTTIIELKMNVFKLAISIAKNLHDNQFLYENCLKVPRYI